MNLSKSILAILILIVGTAHVLAQESVVAKFNEDKSKIIVQNNRNEVIYIFRKDISPNNANVKIFDREITTTKKLFTCDYLDVRRSFVKVLPGQTAIFKIKRTNKQQLFLYYYPCVKNTVSAFHLIPVETYLPEKNNLQSLHNQSSGNKPRTRIDSVQSIKVTQLKVQDTVPKQNLKIDKSIVNNLPKVEKPKETKSPLPAKPNSKPPTAEKQPKISQEKIFKTFNLEFQNINNAECQNLLIQGVNLQMSDKQFLKDRQRKLNQLKKSIEKVEPADANYAKIKSDLISQITSLIENISEITIVESKTIKEDYNEIYSKQLANIDALKELDSEVEKVVEHKLREFSLVRWRNKGPVDSLISTFREAIDNSEKNFDIARNQFISKWEKGDKGDKENLENLLIRRNDELRDGYNKLKYNASIYQKRMDELTPPYAMLILLGFVLLIVVIALIFYIRSFFRSRALKSKKSQMMENSICSIDEDREETYLYESGLDEVRNGVEKNEYYVVDMNTIFDDTAIEKVYISKSCILSIYRFFLEFLKLNGKTNETGCFIVGRWEQVATNSYNISLEEIVEPGNDAIYGEYELDFGTQIGLGLETTIISLRQDTQKDYVQTSWIHSHPSMGLFLSNHDLIVQSQLVYNDYPTRMLAIVIDSNTDDLDTAFFTYKKSGEMNNKEDAKAILSLEEMAQWAKGRRVVEKIVEKPKVSITFDPNNYYEFISNGPDLMINTFYFSASSIIDMDYMVNLNTEGLKGYFYGKSLYKYSDKLLEKKVLIENFRSSKEEENQEPIGCLLVLPQFTYQSVLTKYEPIIDRYDFFVVYNPQKDDVKIISRSLNGKYLIASERDLHSEQMMELKKWTRRRRD